MFYLTAIQKGNREFPLALKDFVCGQHGYLRDATPIEELSDQTEEEVQVQKLITTHPRISVLDGMGLCLICHGHKCACFHNHTV